MKNTENQGTVMPQKIPQNNLEFPSGLTMGNIFPLPVESSAFIKQSRPAKKIKNEQTC